MKKALLLVLSFLSICSLEAKGIGKGEYAPAYVHVDMLQYGNTVKRVNMFGSRLDLGYVTENGWYAKSSAIYAKHPNCRLETLGVSFGRTLPIGEKIFVTPYAGIGYVRVESTISIDFPPFGVLLVSDVFQGLAPHIGVEGTYNFRLDWRVSGSIQYAWTRDRTKIRDKDQPKRHSQGFAFAAQIEHDLNKKWSVNLGAGINESFSHEKSGTRMSGIKLGFARWF